MADKLRLTQVMSNLLSNACKYSPQGARVTIRAREEDAVVRIDVSDTGMGISPEDQERLFTKFFRADNSSTREVSGSGLGLYITKHLIEAHGGRIWASSQLGQGTTFSITWPKAGQEAAVQAAPSDRPGRYPQLQHGVALSHDYVPRAGAKPVECKEGNSTYGHRVGRRR